MLRFFVFFCLDAFVFGIRLGGIRGVSGRVVVFWVCWVFSEGGGLFRGFGVFG